MLVVILVIVMVVVVVITVTAIIIAILAVAVAVLVAVAAAVMCTWSPSEQRLTSYCCSDHHMIFHTICLACRRSTHRKVDQ